MTTDAPAHEEYEVAALRRARGALDVRSAAELEAHLASCASCTEFARTALATETALRNVLRGASAGRDWDRVRAGFRARRRADRNRKLRGLASILAMVALNWWAMGPVLGALLAAFAVAMVAVGYRRVVLPERRRAEEAESADAELLAYYRAGLDKEIKELRSARQVVVVVMFLYVANAVLMVANVMKERWLGHPDPSLESYVATFATFTLVGGAMWFRGRFVLPRLERERRELGE